MDASYIPVAKARGFTTHWIKPVVEIDKEKINEDLKYAGYNLMVTSELDMEPLQVY